MSWQRFDLKTLEQQYSPSSMIGGNYQPYVQSYVDLSAQAKSHLIHEANIRYGSEPKAMFDFFPASRGRSSSRQSPGLLVFIHGGYWQELSRQDSALLAPAWTNAGYAHAVIGYDLAPLASLQQIVQQCQRALHCIWLQASKLGFDPNKIVIAGSSAGAHLTAMLCLMNSAPSLADLRATEVVPILGGVLLSGIFDLEPLVPTYINQALQLSTGQAKALSPQHLLGRHPQSGAVPQLLIAYGEIETSEFKRQSLGFAATFNALGHVSTQLAVAGRNHFDILNTLGDASSQLFSNAEKLFSP
jgi:arylformamidase